MCLKFNLNSKVFGVTRMYTDEKLILILFGFVTENSSLEPLIEALLAQIHIDLSPLDFRPESNRGPPIFTLGAALLSTELK